MKKAKSFALGTTKRARKEAVDEWRENGVTPSGVSAISLGPKETGGRTTRTRSVRVHVPKKLARTSKRLAKVKPVPPTFGGLASDVVENATTGEATPGTGAKYALSAYSGTLTLIFGRNGTNYALSCSHVLAPADVSPQVGDGCLIDQATAALSAWSSLDDSSSPLTADVGLASTALVVTKAWPDGKTFQGTAAYDPSNGPFSVFGNINTGKSSSGSGLSDKLSITVHGYGARTFTGLFSLSVAIGEGDSGAAVRDGADRLVGVVIARESGSSHALCAPWQAVAAEIESLLGNG